jgi:hypothetical protein
MLISLTSNLVIYPQPSLQLMQKCGEKLRSEKHEISDGKRRHNKTKAPNQHVADGGTGAPLRAPLLLSRRFGCFLVFPFVSSQQVLPSRLIDPRGQRVIWGCSEAIRRLEDGHPAAKSFLDPADGLCIALWTAIRHLAPSSCALNLLYRPTARQHSIAEVTGSTGRGYRDWKSSPVRHLITRREPTST